MPNIRPCRERAGRGGAKPRVDSCFQLKTASCKVAPILFALLLFAGIARGQSYTGNLTAANATCANTSGSICVVAVVNSAQGGATFTLSGTFSATIQFEASGDNGTTWVSLNITPSTGAAAVTSATAPGTWQANVAGYTLVRQRCSTYVSGTAVATIVISNSSARTGGGGAAPNGTGGSSSPAAPAMAYYLGPCPTSNTGQCFNSPANTQQVNTCGWTSSTVTCTGSPFVPGDVGKQVMGWNNCNASAGNSGSLQMGQNAITTGAAVTIATYVSANSVTLSTTVANTQTGTASCFIWGSPDDTAAVAVEAAYDSAPFCPKLMLAAANYWFNDPHFTSQPTACANLGYNYKPSTSGNVFYSAGFELEGRGMGTTNIFLGTNFPATATCIAQDTIAPVVGTGKACFLLQVGAKWRDFSITGGSNPTPAMSNEAGTGRELIETISENTMENIMLTNFGAFDSTHTPNGIYSNYQLQLKQVDNSGFGYNGLEVASGRGASTAVMLSIENSLNTDVAILGAPVSGGYSLQCQNCNFFGTYAAAGSVDVFNAGGSFVCNQCLFHNGLVETNPSIMYEATAAGSTAYISNSQMTNTSSITGASGIKCTTGACTNYVQNTAFTAGSGGNTYIDVAGSKFFDLGGNTGYGSGGGVSLSGQIFNENNSVNFAACAAGNLVLSAGWGSTAAATAFTGGTQPCKFTVTNSGTGQGASPTIAYTFPNPYMTSPIACTATQIGGNNPGGTFTSSSLSATGVTFTFSLTPTVSDTEIVQVTCVAP